MTLTDAETIVLSSDARGFPLLIAAQQAGAGCGKCGHANVNVHAMLRVALTRYKNDKQFRVWLGNKMKLPVTIAGVVIE